MKRKFNSFNISVSETEPFEYLVVMENPKTRHRIFFPFETAHGMSDVQQLFYDLTDKQCEELFLKGIIYEEHYLGNLC